MVWKEAMPCYYMKASKLETLASACKPRTWEAEAGELPQIQDEPGQHSEFKQSLDYKVRLCLETKQQPKTIK